MGQPSDTTTERHTTDAGVADHPSRHRQAMYLGCRIQLGHGGTTAYPGQTCVSINHDATHRAEVDHESAVTDPCPRERMTAASHRDLQLVLTGEMQCCGNICW
jgi:hypothetical protein